MLCYVIDVMLCYVIDVNVIKRLPVYQNYILSLFFSFLTFATHCQLCSKVGHGPYSGCRRHLYVLSGRPCELCVII